MDDPYCKMGLTFQGNLKRRIKVGHVDSVSQGRYVLSAVRLAGHVKVSVLILREECEELQQSLVQIHSDLNFVARVTVATTGEAESRADWVVDVDHVD